MGVFTTVIQVLQVCWIYILLGVFVAALISRRYQYGLSDIPGPALASVTDIWAIYRAICGLGVEDYKLHSKYKSTIVRVGPRTVVFSDPGACHQIFGYNPIFRKAGMSF